ncbi:YchJ family metal-binding protein [Thalassotalea sp. G2M2-11]|uniref:YchJ family protein n=1 Tax=Thalassotalea sp. G2M2-11 TaxID=2787627 RepID=UPI0019CF5FF6|nr:YchJ family metal-binding protein [Thalassotalea sp. G2M2-11]
MYCFCGNSKAFEQCCQLIITGDKQANTPESLMRSRYSAYASNNADYIYQTYAEQSKAQQSLTDIAAWASQTQWLRLSVLQSDDITLDEYIHGNDKTLPVVHFIAFYLHDKTFYHMEEASRFTIEDQQWRYLDGDIITHQALKTPKRNDPCLCGSTKKFKQCCNLKL